MDNGTVKYESNQQDALKFWSLVPDTGAYVQHRRVLTTVSLESAFQIAKGAGAVLETEIFWEIDRADDHTIIARFIASGHEPCLVWVAEDQRLPIPQLRGDEVVSEINVWDLDFSFSAVSAADAEWWTNVFTGDLPEVPQSDELPETVVSMDFCLMSPRGNAQTYTRQIDAPDWDDIRSNYAGGAAEALGKVLAGGPSVHGKVGVLTGPPGAGKTTLLRCFARMWREQAEFAYITDPHRLFAEPGYLLDLILNQFQGDTWNVLVIEDAEKYIAMRDQVTTQSNLLQEDTLSTLLNLGDGMLGQGLKIKLIFTTNATDKNIDPAVIRPGRCFMNIEIPPMPRDEAAAWLAEKGMDPEGYTGQRTGDGILLADLYNALNAQ